MRRKVAAHVWGCWVLLLLVGSEESKERDNNDVDEVEMMK